MSDALASLSAAGLAVAAAIACWCLWTVAPAVRLAWLRWQAAVDRVAAPGGAVAGALQRQSLRVGGWCAPAALAMPAPVRARIDVQLARAGLAPTWSAESWLGLQLALLVAAALFVTSLAGTRLLAFWPGGFVLLLATPWQSLQSLRQRVARRLAAIERELPGWLELMALGLEAGTAFPAALARALARAPDGPLREEFTRLVHEMRSGQARGDALRRIDARLGLPALSSVVAAIVQAEASGLSLAPVLRAQARRSTQERFARAEKRAMEAPVRMLGPLVLCIFPCTFIVVGFPIAAMLFWGS
jgi:tight adherence protein C